MSNLSRFFGGLLALLGAVLLVLYAQDHFERIKLHRYHAQVAEQYELWAHDLATGVAKKFVRSCVEADQRSEHDLLVELRELEKEVADSKSRGNKFFGYRYLEFLLLKVRPVIEAERRFTLDCAGEKIPSLAEPCGVSWKQFDEIVECLLEMDHYIDELVDNDGDDRDYGLWNQFVDLGRSLELELGMQG